MHVNSAARPELNFLMNPVHPRPTAQMTDPRRTRSSPRVHGGIRGGTTRNEALALGLVLPYTGQTSIYR